MRARLFARFGFCFCIAGSLLLAGAVDAVGQGAKAKARTDAAAATALVDLNTATAAELEALPGVGKATSKKIIDGRPYNSVDDLAKAGVSAGEIQNIKDLVTASATPKPAAAATPKPRATPKRAAASTNGQPAAAKGPVDLNNADAAEIESLPGIGPVLAAAIVKGRPYQSFADLGQVKGLGKAKIAGLNGRVKFGSTGAAATEKAQTDATATPTPTPTPSPVAVPAPASVPAAKAKAARTPKSATASAGTGTAAAGSSTPKPAAVPARTPKPPALPPGQKVNINTATKETLDALFGIGPVKAQAIIDARPFKTIDDIKNVKGIKDVEFNAIKNQITVQ